MTLEIKIPNIAEAIVEVVVAKWLKRDGETVKRDEPICEIETDKASQELYAEADGTLQTIAKEGETVLIGAIIAKIQTNTQKLVRFDWAIKKILRNKANFDVLEGFLSELLGFDVKVEQILESESNKIDENDKFNRVDILVRTQNNDMMLIEVQNDPEIDYFQRILYGVSKLVTEYIKEGEGYETITKIVSISLVYFKLGQGTDYIYEYKGAFIGKNKQDILQPTSWQKKKFKAEKVADILPKYYILKVNNFDKTAETGLDEWIYFLKNSELPPKVTAKGLKEAGEKLRIDQLSETERKEYERFKQNRWTQKSIEETAEIMSRYKEKINFANNAIKKGFDDNIIAELTGLTPTEVAQIRDGIDLLAL